MASIHAIVGDEPSSAPSTTRNDASQEVKPGPENTSSPSTSRDDTSQIDVDNSLEDASLNLPTATDLLKSIDSKITPPEVHRKELTLLQNIHKQLQSESTKIQFLWNAFLQITGIIFVVIFGAFSIIAYRIGEQANKQSNQANQLALLSFCFASNSSTVEGLCGDVLQRATQTLPPLVTLVMGPAPSLIGNSTTLPEYSLKSTQNIIALSIGIVSVLVAMVSVGTAMKKMWDEKFERV
ncbi:hypothetical protein N431DRAFT_532808 [Stipitochalara longipes BDJ]|nr:hypothetical protein N431DRAFT_532808 [Stipitochalara longipes BDJ]